MPITKHLSAIIVCTLLMVSNLNAAPLEYYLPKDMTYTDSIATPDTIIGHPVGDFHARHDRVVAYMEYLAKNSTRATLIKMGKTWEQRPQVLLVVSAPENIQRLIEQLNTDEGFVNDTNAPLVVWLGYSVHGNEASGTNASLLTAYHLNALESDAHEQFLKDTIVVIDPSLNPDGYGRFSTWANNNRSLNLVSDPVDREHLEDWPRGRTNHYRFDLNRDWLLATQQESQNRLEWFHTFHPNVFADFHEMGTNSTYFFQPGVPSRQNPLTPDENFEITSEIAKYHAKALDEIGTPYYTKQGFDDFYFGKGSTYPDIQGSIGILFEQASSRGHLQESENGPLSFSFGIRNQFTTSLSTMAGAYANRSRLKDYRDRFYQMALRDAGNDSSRGIVIGDDGDPDRLDVLVSTLIRHHIRVFRLAEKVSANNKTFNSGVVIPYLQPQYRLIKAMFETRTRFRDNTFYDVSAWNFGHAYNLPFETVDRRRWKNKLLGSEITEITTSEGEVKAKSKVGYILDWSHFNTARALQKLLAKGVKVRVARLPFTLETSNGKQNFKPGAIVIPVGIQAMSSDRLYNILQTVTRKEGLTATSVESGLALRGIDLGSPDMEPLTAVRPLMLVGEGTSSYDTGELWFFMDKHLDIALTQANIRHMGRVKLERYTHLIMAQGNYEKISEDDIERLRAWVQDGGVIIGMKSANKWLSENKFISGDVSKNTSKLNDSDRRLYSDMKEDNAQRHIGGSIFSVAVDQSHPLSFGINSNRLSVFKNHRFIMQDSKNPYHNVMRYVDSPLVSGYASEGNLEAIADSVYLAAERQGRGSVIAIADNPVFRGYWLGSSRILVNSLFFGTAFERARQ